MTNRRREYRILAIYCAVGGAVLGALTATGRIVPATTWSIVGGTLIGVWVGLAIYRLRSDSLI